MRPWSSDFTPFLMAALLSSDIAVLQLFFLLIALLHAQSHFLVTGFIEYGGPEGTTLLRENVASFCKNITISLEFCNRSL